MLLAQHNHIGLYRIKHTAFYKVDNFSEEERPILIPVACFCHDDEVYYIDFELPGVDKEHIELNVSPQSVCVAAFRDDAEFAGCWVLAHEVNEGKTEAKYENGLLRVRIPLKKPAKGKKIEIK